MEDFRKSIETSIKTNRPALGAGSIKTYVSILSNLYKKLNATGDDIDWFNKEEKEIMEFLKEKPAQTRKSILSALFVLTGNEAYRELMLKDCGVVNNQYKEQKKSTKEAENWISTEDIRKIYDGLLEKVSSMFKRNLVGDYQTIIQFWLVALLGGVAGIPPRRSLDYGAMKIRNYNPKEDNYYKAGKFYFNRYKTADKYGLQTIDVPKDLQALLKKWIKINDTDYLLFSSNKKPLSSPQITRILNKIFGKKVSVDMCRHIYLTNLYKDVPALSQMEKTASEMSHSLATALTYIKKD